MSPFAAALALGPAAVILGVFVPAALSVFWVVMARRRAGRLPLERAPGCLGVLGVWCAGILGGVLGGDILATLVAPAFLPMSLENPKRFLLAAWYAPNNRFGDAGAVLYLGVVAAGCWAGVFLATRSWKRSKEM